jgi:hypothetical protein
MPAGPVDDYESDRSGCDTCPNLRQMLVHRCDADDGQDQSAANATGRADRTEQIRPVEAPVAQRARAAAAPSPDAGQRALLANSCFVLEPDFDQLTNRALAERLFC